MLLHVVSAAAPAAATAGHWVWEKSNSAVNRVSFFFLSIPNDSEAYMCLLRYYLFDGIYNVRNRSRNLRFYDRQVWRFNFWLRSNADYKRDQTQMFDSFVFCLRFFSHFAHYAVKNKLINRL